MVFGWVRIWRLQTEFNFKFQHFHSTETELPSFYITFLFYTEQKVSKFKTFKRFREVQTRIQKPFESLNIDFEAFDVVKTFETDRQENFVCVFRHLMFTS